jgi:hypothetical protein
MTMKILMVITGLLLVVTLLLSVSCGRAPSEAEEQSGRMILPAPEIEVEEEKVSAIETAAPVAIDVGEDWATERMIVRTGNMSLVVEDVPDAIEQITGMANNLGGYVVSSRVWKERERLIGSIAIRVPAEYFDDATRALRELAVEVNSEHATSKDVTEEYVDLSAKLKNLEATEDQLLKIMEKAETVEDILDVQRELSRTRGDIEQTKARMQYLERTSATSLIEVSLEQSKLDVVFTANKTRVKEREKIWFYGEVAGGFPPYSYEWDFGDGTTSTEGTPTQAYKADGSYTVSLTVTDDRGNTDTETRTDYINVLPGWSAGSIASGAWNGLVTFGHVLANILIWIGIFSPVWIVIGGIVFWWKWRRRKRSKAE